MAEPKLNRYTTSRMNKMAKGIRDNLDSLYKSTHYSSALSNRELQNLSRQINDNLDRIVDRNMQNTGFSNISKLYSRVYKTTDLSKGDIGANLQKMFEDPIAMEDLYTSFMNTKYLKELDEEIDTLIKYMPSLGEALEVKKDNVLSSDYFSKDYLTITSTSIGKDETEATFNERCKNLKETYNLLTFVEEVYDHAAKYGECFVYCVPYKTAIGRLLSRKGNTLQANNTIRYSRYMKESTGNGRFKLFADHNGSRIFNENKQSVMSEGAYQYAYETDPDRPNVKLGAPKLDNLYRANESVTIDIEFCNSNIIESLVDNRRKALGILNESDSLQEQFLTENGFITVTESDGERFQALGNLSFGKRDENLYSQDGLIGDKSKDKEIKVNVPGCILKRLPRDQVIPIYIDDMCMGYYYIELKPVDYDDQMHTFDNTLGNSLTNGNRYGDKGAFNNITDPLRQDEMIRNIAAQLSKFIDKNFVNSNQDLRKEIYMLLKYNDIFNTTEIDRLKVTYINPEDIVHVYFKQDEDTKRGISDLAMALIPATIRTSILLTNSIGIITRGQDKRVYYIKQNIEQNIAKTMLNAVAQIKQGNFGARQFQNINNVLNISGRFNDYVIPVGPSGDYPIQFEVMEGQRFENPTDLLDMLEDMAINSTGVPKEIIQSRQSIDYAMQLSMSSSKFLRYLYNRQARFQDFIKIIINKVYCYEYEENVRIDVNLPPPAFLNITNSAQLVDNTSQYIDKIIESDLPNAEDEYKAIVKKELFRYHIGSHFDVTKHDFIYERCKLMYERQKEEAKAKGEDPNAGNGGY